MELISWITLTIHGIDIDGPMLWICSKYNDMNTKDLLHFVHTEYQVYHSHSIFHQTQYCTLDGLTLQCLLSRAAEFEEQYLWPQAGYLNLIKTVKFVYNNQQL